MKKSVIVFIFVFLLTLPVFAGEGSFSVIYLPADDRPLQDEQMRLFADSLGVELIMPDRNLYGRNAADHREALLSWLLKQQGDYYMVSLDCLLSGGLLESRERSGDTQWEEKTILRLKEFAEGKQGFFLDSLLRLASNVESVKELSNYHATLDFARGLEPNPPEDYLEIRHRKLRLNLFAAKTLPGYLLGVELIMPERSLYGRDPSDHREALLSWLLAQQGDYYIVSLDCLLSGGLLESRELTGDAVWEEQVILRLKGFSEGKEGYFLDSLLRLASNVESVKELSNYHATLDFARGLEPNPPEDYLEIRQRKLRLNLFAAKTLPGYLLGVDDSWEGETVQTSELALLREFVPPEQIFSTFDALPRLAFAKLFLEESGQIPGVKVRYFGDGTIVPVHNFESAEDMTKKTLSFFGVREGENLEILILTETVLGNAVIQAARENQKRQIPTVLINLCPRQEDFEQAFLTLAPGQLLAYSGYGSSVNATHLGLSMGLARYAALSLGMENIPQQTRLLATLLADEFGYAAILGEVQEKARDLGLDIYDFCRPFRKLETFTLDKMRAKTRPVLSALNQGGILTGVKPYRVASPERVSLTGGYFPWHRCFEYHGVIE